MISSLLQSTVYHGQFEENPANLHQRVGPSPTHEGGPIRELTHLLAFSSTEGHSYIFPPDTCSLPKLFHLDSEKIWKYNINFFKECILIEPYMGDVGIICTIHQISMTFLRGPSKQAYMETDRKGIRPKGKESKRNQPNTDF